jgi:quercetin dioxygenase-like cupin family protein
MDIKKLGERPSIHPPAEYFSGTVWMEAVADASVPNAAKSVVLSFAPGARTAWHTHPLGQMLYVISGVGLAQSWGGPIREMRAGDSVWFDAGEKHWHGATPTNAMVHFAVQEAKDGKTVDWLEHVTDAQYAASV